MLFEAELECVCEAAESDASGTSSVSQLFLTATRTSPTTHTHLFRELTVVLTEEALGSGLYICNKHNAKIILWKSVVK